MTARHAERCWRNTFAIRMYHLANKTIEDLSVVRHEIEIRGDYAAFFDSAFKIGPHRSNDTPPAVNLTDSNASWAGSDAFEVRWTTLAA